MLSEFLGSSHATQATSALAAHGVTGDTAKQYLSHAVEAAHAHVHQEGLLGNQPGKDFLIGGAAGLVKGDGVTGAIGDGLESVLGGRIAGAIAEKAGVNSNMASTVGAAVTPFLVSFLKKAL